MIYPNPRLRQSLWFGVCFFFFDRILGRMFAKYLTKSLQIALHIALFSLILAAMPSGVSAQENQEQKAPDAIWMPLENTQNEVVPASNQPEQALPQNNALDEIVKLQTDLYKVVLTFDAQASIVESEIRKHEEIVIHNHELKMTVKPIVLEDGSTEVPGVSYFRVPTLCSELDESLKRYIAKNSAALENAVQVLAEETKSMSETEKAEMAQKLRVALAAIPNLRRAEEILYICLYRFKNELGYQPSYMVERTMRTWFTMQEPLLDAWLGDVD